MVKRKREARGTEHRDPGTHSREVGHATRAHGPAPSDPDERAQAPGHWWPDGEPLPDHYVRMTRRYACPKCKRTSLSYGSQAVVCESIPPTKDGDKGAVAYMRSRCCDVRWQLPVRG